MIWNKLIIILLLLIPSFSFAYGDSMYGTVMYGGTSSSEIEAALVLAGDAVITDAGTIDMTVLLALDGSAEITDVATLTIVKQLALDVVAQMEFTGTLDRQGALNLSVAINQTQISTVNISSVVTLIGFAVYSSQASGIGIDADLALSAISEIVLTNTMARAGELTLQSSINAEFVNTTIQNAVTSLSAQGNFTGASQMIANGAVLLQALSTQGQTSNVNWAVLLELSGQVAEDFQSFMAGTAYDAILTLSVISAITEAAKLDAFAETTLSAEAAITAILTDVIKEGIVTLQAQGNMESASQLAAYGALLLSILATETDQSNQIFSNIPLVLSAIATAVTTGDFAEIAEIVTRRVFIKDNDIRHFLFDNDRRLLNAR